MRRSAEAMQPHVSFESFECHTKWAETSLDDAFGDVNGWIQCDGVTSALTERLEMNVSGRLQYKCSVAVLHCSLVPSDSSD